MPADRRRLFLILNGKNVTNELVRTAVDFVRRSGCYVEVRVTYEAGDSTRLVQEALSLCQQDSCTIVAAGGDGTINEVVDALIAAGCPETTQLAVLPIGTANDFASSLGIPLDPWEALQMAIRCPAMPVDVGTVNGKAFINVATAGFGSDITTKTDPAMKKQIGGVAYLVTGVSNLNDLKPKTAVLRGPVTVTAHDKGSYYQIQPDIEPPTSSQSSKPLMDPHTHSNKRDWRSRDPQTVADGNKYQQAESTISHSPTSKTTSTDGRLSAPHEGMLPASTHSGQNTYSDAFRTHALQPQQQSAPLSQQTGQPKAVLSHDEHTTASVSDHMVDGDDAGARHFSGKTAKEQLQLLPEGTMAQVEGELLLLAVGNGRQAGCGIHLCPHAVLDDGLLDVSYLLNCPHDRVGKLLRGLQKHGTLGGAISYTGSMRVPWLQVQTDEMLQVNRDGEPTRSTQYRFEVLHKRLRLHMPPDSNLLQTRPGKEAVAAYEQYLTCIEQAERPPRLRKTRHLNPLVLALTTHSVAMGLGFGMALMLQVLRGQLNRSK